ncbi:ABC-three component system middle component 5 [Pectobacterium polaris]|uniref:ABC-three component system middle component 5 n=1 Tax=Pectobacterium polaris TaxID=2042057 RepID=UPI001583B2A2|nr:ABC-three component system middle component 5 [Pectobacterium polaris]
MIIYHPFKDANHCLYRIISLLYNNKSSISEEQISFMDFYYLFPSQLKNITGWPRANSKLAIGIGNIGDSYENIENPRRVFFELNTIRKNTLAHLFSKKIISLNENNLHLHEDMIPKELLNKLQSDSFRKGFEYSVIAKEIPKIKFKGKNGLKAKTNLMEYRYDK